MIAGGDAPSVLRWIAAGEYALEHQLLEWAPPALTPNRELAEKLTTWVHVWRLCNESRDALGALRAAGFRFVLR